MTEQSTAKQELKKMMTEIEDAAKAAKKKLNQTAENIRKMLDDAAAAKKEDKK